MSQSTAPEPASPSQPVRKRRPLRWVFAVLALGLLVAVGTAPYWALGLAKPKVEAAMSEALHADVVISDMRATWGGASVEGLAITGKDGFKHASLAALDMSVATWKALRGQYDIQSSITGGRINARQDADGRWSFADLGGPPAEPGEDPEQTGEELGAPPQLTAKLSLADLEVHLETPRGKRNLRVDSGTIDITALDQAAQISLSGTLDGDGLDAQPLNFEGELVPWDFVGADPSGHMLASVLSIGDALTFSASAPSPKDPAGAKLSLAMTLGPIVQLIAPFVDLPVPTNGKFELEAALGSADEGSNVTLRLLEGRADMETAPMLARVHPVFYGLDSSKGGGLSGDLSAELKLEIPGKVDLAAWLENPPLEALVGSGNIRLGKLGITGSQWLDQLTGYLGASPKQLDLAPLNFKVGGGKLNYTDPWKWNVAGSPTTFAGGMEMNGALQLDWKIPLVESFVTKLNLPAGLVGEELVLPLRGSVTNPKVPWKDALAGIAKKGLQSELENRAKEQLDKVLPGGVEGALEKVLPGGVKVPESVSSALGGLELPLNGEDAAKQLLTEADKLWNAGEKEKARPLYAKIRDDYKLTTVYLLNKSRIKDRR